MFLWLRLVRSSQWSKKKLIKLELIQERLEYFTTYFYDYVL